MIHSVQKSATANTRIEKKRKEGSGSALDGVQPLDSQKKAKIQPRVTVPADLRLPGEDHNSMISKNALRLRQRAAFEPLTFVPVDLRLPGEDHNTTISQQALRMRQQVPVPVPVDLRRPGEDDNTTISQNALRLRQHRAYEPRVFDK